MNITENDIGGCHRVGVKVEGPKWTVCWWEVPLSPSDRSLSPRLFYTWDFESFAYENLNKTTTKISQMNTAPYVASL